MPVAKTSAMLISALISTNIQYSFRRERPLNAAYFRSAARYHSMVASLEVDGWRAGPRTTADAYRAGARGGRGAILNPTRDAGSGVRSPTRSGTCDDGRAATLPEPRLVICGVRSRRREGGEHVRAEILDEPPLVAMH